MKALAKVTYLVLEGVDREKAEPIMVLLTTAIDSLEESTDSIRKAIEQNRSDSTSHG